MLKYGDRVEIAGTTYRVVMVNECRAHVIPERRVRKVIVDRVWNTRVEFEAVGRGLNISPYSPAATGS